MTQRREALRKLGPAQVREIRRLHRKGHSRNALARDFGISKTALQRILEYSTYRDC